MSNSVALYRALQQKPREEVDFLHHSVRWIEAGKAWKDGANDGRGQVQSQYASQNNIVEVVDDGALTEEL